MGNINKTISVVMATYNGAKYLREQLNSILSQSIHVNEIIIVDDCSSDDTIEIIKDYQQQYPFIHLIINKFNMGVVKTFEMAISNCHGKYILFSDQDDVWFENKVETLVNNIGDNLLIYSDAVVVDQKLNKISESNLAFFETARDFSKYRDYLFGNNVTGCTMMVNREILTETLPFPEFKIMFHDQYLALYAAFKSKIKKLNIPLMFYRQHDKNVAASYRSIPYSIIIKNSGKMADDIKTIKNLELYSHNGAQNDFNLASDFFLAMAHKKYPPISLLCFCKREFSLRMFFWFIRMACLSKFFAQLNYNLAPFKAKIKKWVAR